MSVDLAEAKGLIISASTDQRVHLWTMKGRFIGESVTNATGGVTVEPLNKGHIGIRSNVPCREAVLISEVNSHQDAVELLNKECIGTRYTVPGSYKSHPYFREVPLY